MGFEDSEKYDDVIILLLLLITLHATIVQYAMAYYAISYWNSFSKILEVQDSGFQDSENLHCVDFGGLDFVGG